MEETRLEEAAGGKPEWYQNLKLEEAELFISANLKSAARSVIAIGYYLKCIRDGRLYLEAGYETIWEYAQDRYGFSMSTASRYMARNDKFSQGGNSPVLDEKYRDFSKAQLQEMLSLDSAALEQVTPDMTVREIREFRRPPVREIPYFEIPGQMSLENFLDVQEPEKEAAPEPGKTVFVMRGEEFFPDGRTEEEFVATPQQAAGAAELLPEQRDDSQRAEETVLSAYGTPRRGYPEDSLIATEGCEGGHDCFLCAMDCRLRGKERYCREAPLGNSFPCEIVKAGFRNLGAGCQFVNPDLAEHYAGSGEADPCCKNCSDPCEYICGRAMRDLDRKQEEESGRGDDRQETAGEEEGPEGILEEQGRGTELSDLELLRKMLDQEKRELEEFLKVDKAEPLPQELMRKRKLLVAALAGLLCNLETETEKEEETIRQPELPILKNSGQRKEWLRNYKAWGLWYVDEHIGVRYYKYEFPNGARLIVEEETARLPDGREYETAYYHLVGGPEPPRHPQYGYGRWSWHKSYSHHPDSETELVEFLKEAQK